MVTAAKLPANAEIARPSIAPRLSIVPPAPAAVAVVEAQTPAKPEAYVGLVRKVAYSMARRLPSRVDVRDLISSGTIGLLDAMAKYDPKQNDNFEAYAEIRIRGAILDELRGLDWVPRSVRQKSHALDKKTRELEGTLGRAPSDEEVATSLSMSIDGYYEMVNDVRSVTMLSLEDMMGPTGTAHLGAAAIAEDDPLDSMCRRATASALAAALEELPERDRLVLTLYYLEGLKLKEIGEILAVTESRVCQIHGHAIKRLKAALQDA